MKASKIAEYICWVVWSFGAIVLIWGFINSLGG